MKKSLSLTIIALLFFSSPIYSGEADVVDVQVRKNSETTCTFDVTISYKDTGWDPPELG